MRITSIEAENILPVRMFLARDLSDVVILAGPNGVGKTRFLNAMVDNIRNKNPQPGIRIQVDATTKAEEEAWGSRSLNTANHEEKRKLFAALQSNPRRGAWRSSILNFESDRTIQQLNALSFTFDMTDPLEEKIDWGMGLGRMRDRFQDTVHALYRLVEHQKQSIANKAVQLRREGKEVMHLHFSDPIDPFRRVFSELLAPKEMVDLSAKDQRLQYQYQDRTFLFDQLSSGEREVVNIAFDFLLRQPSDCIVIFDEPELHLHPELTYRLIRTLQGIGERNQFFLCTHSAEVISSSLDRTVIFIAPPAALGETIINQAIAVSETDESSQALRLLGQSIGVVSLGKKLVLIEGANSSLDKQVYGSILKNRFPNLVLVPVGGKDTIVNFSEINRRVLQKSIWGVDFFMLCDGDSNIASSPMAQAENDGRLKRLSMYHLENYFLDAKVWVEVFKALEAKEEWMHTSDAIEERLKKFANECVSYAVALLVSAELRLKVGNIDVMPKKCHGVTFAQLIEITKARIADERGRIDESLTDELAISGIESRWKQIQDALTSGDQAWKNIIPGRPILARLASTAAIPADRAKRLYIKHALEHSPQTFSEITAIFESFHLFGQRG